jgi:hypothetical protein
MMTIKEFCKRHHACLKGMEWAVNNCSDMQDVWNKAKPEWLLWIATQDGVLTDEELKLFAVWAARQVRDLMTDQRSINALDVSVRYLNGAATESELAAARAEAWEAATEAARAAASAIFTARSAARAEAWEAARSAARAARAAMDAARAAAWASTNDAATEAATDAARAVRSARYAAVDAQARYLRANCKPIFGSNN